MWNALSVRKSTGNNLGDKVAAAKEGHILTLLLSCVDQLLTLAT